MLLLFYFLIQRIYFHVVDCCSSVYYQFPQNLSSQELCSTFFLQDREDGPTQHRRSLRNCRMAGIPEWLSSLASAFGPGSDPRVLGSSPPSGSLHGACFSLCLCLCLSLYVFHEWINEILKKRRGGHPWVAEQFSICLWPRAWSWSPGIESHIRLPAWILLLPPPVSAYLSLSLSVSLSWINK